LFIELANANTIHALSWKEALVAQSYDVKRYRQCWVVLSSILSNSVSVGLR